jgi:hypothetical protein
MPQKSNWLSLQGITITDNNPLPNNSFDTMAFNKNQFWVGEGKALARSYIQSGSERILPESLEFAKGQICSISVFMQH